MTNHRIICTAHIQQWSEENYAEVLFTEEFDATEHILTLGRATALKIRDNSHESDELAPPEIISLVESIPEGTFYVTCEDAIRAYFKAHPE